MIAAFLSLCPPRAICDDAQKADPAAAEIKIGTQESKKFDSDPKTKFVKDQAVIDRIQRIGAVIAEVANRVQVPAQFGKSDLYKFNYTIKVLDDKDVNAFSLPGGFVYINKGLIDYAQSDDEIAGVIGHEMGHIAHHHSMQLLAAQNKEMIGVAAAVLAGALGHMKSDTVGGIYQVGSYLALAKLSGYGQKAEFDADRTAVNFLAQTKYNPVGILTMMQRLAMDEARKPTITLGIYATHPPSQERAERLIDEIQRLGLPINRRLVTNYSGVDVKPVDKSTAYAVWIARTEIIRLADSGGKKASERAEIAASNLRNKLFAGAQNHDVKFDQDTSSVSIMSDDVITPSAEDAALAGTTVADLAKSTAGKIRQALMDEILQEGF
jgi:hypothetical protein